MGTCLVGMGLTLGITVHGVPLACVGIQTKFPSKVYTSFSPAFIRYVTDWIVRALANYNSKADIIVNNVSYSIFSCRLFQFELTFVFIS